MFALVLLSVYATIYVFVVESPPHRACHMAPDDPLRQPKYHGLPTFLFAPAYFLDREWLRPNLWTGQINVLEQDMKDLAEQIEAEKTQRADGR